ncbi:MAG: NUDIX hydrolase [Chlamydiales bacterium]
MTEKAKQYAAREKSAKVESEIIHEGKIFFLRKDRILIEGEAPRIRDVIVHPGAVVLIPITSEGNLLLVKQWRRAANQVMTELPAGTLEPDESTFSCAQRELQEETGYFAKEIIPFGGCFTIPSFCTEYLHFFLARGLQHSPLPPDADEEIDLITLTLDEACAMIDNGEINDAKTIAGISRYERLVRRSP